jgi:hypothetical protein
MAIDDWSQIPNRIPYSSILGVSHLLFNSSFQGHISDTSSNIGDTSSHRVKRWFFSDTLSIVTGLVSEKSLKALETNEYHLKQAESKINDEIVSIENKTNTILESIVQQNEKVSNLYTAEAAVEENLKLLLRDESSALGKISLLAKTFEVTNDIDLEFGGFGLLVSEIPQVLIDLERSVLSIIDESLTASEIESPVVQKLIDKYGQVSLSHISVNTRVSNNNFGVCYMIPVYHPKFQSQRVKILPIWDIEKDVFYEVDPVDTVIYNENKEFLTVHEGDCIFSRGFQTCNGDLVIWRKYPIG